MHDTAGAVRTELGMRFPGRGRERHALNFVDAPAQVVTHTFDVDTLLDTSWVGPLASGLARPNVLIQCPASDVPALAVRLERWASPPFTTCVVGDRLNLPPVLSGTVLLHDVARLTVSQQIEVFDWLSLRAGAVQVVAITTVPLMSRVESGSFLQALYYRLNVLQARAGWS